MKKKWMLAYPIYGKWFRVHDSIQAATIAESALDHLISHEIKVNSFRGRKPVSWVLNTQERIKVFYWYLQESIGTKDRVRLRMFFKERLL